MVDLGDPAIADHHANARFVARVCTERERARIAESADPKALLWTLYAAKEAAYKVAVKLGYAPGFAHRRFEVDGDRVSYRDVALGLRVDADADRIHAIATTEPGPIEAAVLPAPAGAHASIAVRTALCTAVAARLGCPADELEVVRERIANSWDGFGPPHLHRAGAPVDVDVSLSHDRRFIAYAFSSDA